MRHRFFVAFFVAILSITPCAAATITTFATEGSYNAAVGAQLFFLDFNSEPVGSGSGNFVGQVDFGSPEALDPSEVFFNDDAMTDIGSTVATNFVGPVDGVFAAPVYAFALVFSSSGNPQTVELYDAGNVLLGAPTTPNNGFFGLTSDTAISSFVIRNGEFSAGNRDRFFVDDFRANALGVPEPSTLLLFGVGLAGVVRRRR